MYCSTCGVAVAQGLSYCKNCGAKIHQYEDADRSADAKEALLVRAMVITFAFGLLLMAILMGVMTPRAHSTLFTKIESRASYKKAEKFS